MVLTTWSNAVSITEIVFDRALLTYSLVPFGVSTKPYGSVPTTICFDGFEMIPFAILSLITLTVPLTVFATYAFEPSGIIATPLGSVWTGTSASFRFRSDRRSKKLTLLLSGLTTARNSSAAVIARG